MILEREVLLFNSCVGEFCCCFSYDHEFHNGKGTSFGLEGQRDMLKENIHIFFLIVMNSIISLVHGLLSLETGA
jgi:hypothetical protein